MNFSESVARSGGGSAAVPILALALVAILSVPAHARPFSHRHSSPNESRQHAEEPVAAASASAGEPARQPASASIRTTYVAGSSMTATSSRENAERAPRRKGGLLQRLFGGSDQEEKKSRYGRDAAEDLKNNPQYRPYPNAVQKPTYIDRARLAASTHTNTRVIIDISKQRGYLLVNDLVAVDAPISSARPGKSTPRGTFHMSERVRSGKVSTIYDVAMPYWMRLDGTLYGVHAGYLPGHPASAGCVRFPQEAAELIYDNTKAGTRVEIRSSWAGAPETGLVGEPVRLVYKVQV